MMRQIRCVGVTHIDNAYRQSPIDRHNGGGWSQAQHWLPSYPTKRPKTENMNPLPRGAPTIHQWRAT